jgi:hypothetical protein
MKFGFWLFFLFVSISHLYQQSCWRISEVIHCVYFPSKMKRLSWIMLQLLVTVNTVPSLLILFNLIMEAVYSSETSVIIRAKRHHIPEDVILHSHQSEHLKYYINQPHVKESAILTNSTLGFGVFHNIKGAKGESLDPNCLVSKACSMRLRRHNIRPLAIYFVCISQQWGAAYCLMYFPCHRRLHNAVASSIILISQDRSISCRDARHT